MRSLLLSTVAGACLLAPSLASAQTDADCPPGAWFCEETEPNPDAADTDDVDDAATNEPQVVTETDADGTRKIVIIDKAPPPSKPARRRIKKEWGFNLHLQGVMMGRGHQTQKPAENAGMGGLGFSLRYRPVPHFAFDAGLDFIGGIDYEGNERAETALLLNGIVFFNPKDKVQVYALGGLGFSGAQVNERQRVETTDGDVLETEERKEFSYFGGQLGMGVEFRIGRKTALNLDVIGFVRGRTDEQARTEPEFVDPETGRTTNTSGGGLFRGGITFYW
ncbi:MAG: outer membrane beta-barrel protein [Polyangiaceae bacterium]|nr:outer membrane beta-barrel protein [Polyangiaceae bacterium]